MNLRGAWQWPTCLFMFWGLVAVPAWAKTAEEIYAMASPSVVVIYSDGEKSGSQGSGVVIEPGEVITNCHVIGGRTVIIGEGKRYPAKVRYADKVRDLCQLAVAGLPNPAIRFASEAPRIGQKVYAIGNPRGLDRTLSDGLISSIRDTQAGYPMLQISAPITFGSSGGGLFDENGHLIGITSKGMGAANLNFALPVTLIPQLAYTTQKNLPEAAEIAAADSVRLALSRAMTDATPPKVRIEDIDQRVKYLHWVGEMSTRLMGRMPDRQMRIDFIETVWFEARRAGLAPDLVLGIIEINSDFRKYHVSESGARGYMAVPVEWTKRIGDGDPEKLFHTQTNLRYGCSILRLFIDEEHGDLFLALGKLGGKRGKPEYPNKVLTAWKKWEMSR